MVLEMRLKHIFSSLAVENPPASFSFSLTLIQMAILGLLTLVAEDAYAHENVGVGVLGHQC